MRLPMLTCSWTKCWPNSWLWKRRGPAEAIRAKAAVGRSSAAQGRYGDLVCLFLWHAVAGDRTAVRHSVWHTLWAVRPRDSARPLAPVAQPAAPHLAARLR